jgi:alkanesulfonate monooxygenase SsuD/methylene tetrahydromethanopterin reductase-like flavin-dependent oxidoreductase (luciferase family)
MKVGLYFDLRNPPGWPHDPSRLYGFTLELCEEAERLGASSVWFSEHHLFEDAYLPQPLTFAAAVAARTRRVRIGTAVLLAPLHGAVEIAEQAAVVDIISGGRLDLGLGAGYRVPEFELFGADIGRRYGTTDERVRELRRIWSEGRVTPAPVQDRVPIWLGYQGPQGARRAGRLGEHLLSVSPELTEPYVDGLKEGGHDAGSARRAGSMSAWVTDDPERDWPVVSKHLAYQLDTYRRYGVEGTGAPLPRPVDPDRLVAQPPGRILGSFVYGTAADVAARLQAHLADVEVDTLFFWASLAGMPEAMVAAEVASICTDLAPLLVAA